MKVLVMGAGAIGSVFGGTLANAGNNVTFIGRESHMQAIRSKGLKISGIFGDYLVPNIKTYTSASEVKERDFDFVFLSVKSFDTEEAARQVLPLLSEKTPVISLQNGLGNIEKIAEVVGEHRTVGGRVIFGVEAVEAGHVKVTVFGDKVLLGSKPGKVPMARIAKIAEAITKAGIPTEMTDEIERHLWGKILYNSCLNALSAILDCHYGALGEYPETKDIVKKVIAEIFEVAKSEGVNLGFKDTAEYEALFFGKLLPNTYSHHSSTLQDLKRGRKTEIDAMNGIIARLGEKNGVATPANLILTQLVHAKEKMFQSQKSSV